MKAPTCTLMLLVCLLALGQTSYVTLEWDANTEPSLAGYTAYVGTNSRVYTAHVSVDAPRTTVSVSNLVLGTTYFFAVTAFDAFSESEYSDEVMFRVPSCSRPTGLSVSIMP